ncbi:MAG TPA: RNA polymerase sigma-70 factor [Hanamia sp.]|nr:RNA polymerase sigma-70 factor [Hanamia sp.]
MQIKSTHESEFALAFQQGEEKGFDFFFRDLFPALCFFANHILDNRCEAEDIASSAFIKIWKKHQQFDNAKNIRSYLYQIVRNDCLKFHQQQKRSAIITKEIRYLSIGDLENNYEADIIRAEFLSEIYKFINTLPTGCRKIFKMLYIHGKSVKEISNELGITASTIRTQKAKGLAVLKKKVKIISIFIF